MAEAKEKSETGATVTDLHVQRLSNAPKMLVAYIVTMQGHKNNIGEWGTVSPSAAYEMLKRGFVVVLAGPLSDREVFQAGGVRAWMTKNKAKVHAPERVLKNLPPNMGLPDPDARGTDLADWDDVDWTTGSVKARGAARFAERGADRG